MECPWYIKRDRTGPVNAMNHGLFLVFDFSLLIIGWGVYGLVFRACQYLVDISALLLFLLIWLGAVRGL